MLGALWVGPEILASCVEKGPLPCSWDLGQFPLKMSDGGRSPVKIEALPATALGGAGFPKTPAVEQPGKK